MNEQRPKRRWPWFRLRTLLIAVLVLSLPLSWCAVRMEKARRQRDVVEMIERMGGYVGYDGRPIPAFCPKVTGKRKPTLLRGILGDDFFDTVVVVSFDNYPSASLMPATRRVDLDDDDLRKVARLKHLQRIGLQGANVTDAGLEHLHGMTSLEHLDLLNNMRVTDAGIEHLGGLINLRWLSLEGTQVTSEGVEKLQETLSECKVEY